MINKYSFGHKVAEFLAQKLLRIRSAEMYFSTKQRASCLVKLVFMYDGKVVVGKKIKSDSLSKVCLPYGYIDLANFASNEQACVKAAFDKLNIQLDEIDFEKTNLIDVKLDYEDDIAQLVYVYKYELLEREYNQISDSYSLYDFFLLDFDCLNEYNKKNRFVTDLDYVILKKINKG